MKINVKPQIKLLAKNTMNDLDKQKVYWDSVAKEKTFTNPLKIKSLKELIPIDGSILDYGCGYGRLSSELVDAGFTDVTGVDISNEMIKYGLIQNPSLNLKQIDGGRLPFPDNAFSACVLFAVLTCMPTNTGQTNLISEIRRVLKTNGILYLSDYPLQQDKRNNERYNQFKDEFGTFGIFRLSDGGVVRHHQIKWIYSLLSEFDFISEERFIAPTMNGNSAEIFQIIARKK